MITAFSDIPMGNTIAQLDQSRAEQRETIKKGGADRADKRLSQLAELVNPHEITGLAASFALLYLTEIILSLQQEEREANGGAQ